MIFIVLTSWPRSLREFTRFIWWMESSAKRPPTFRPSHMTWAVSPPVLGSYRLQPPSPFIIITQPESWYSFTVPRRVEGWVDLGTAGKVHPARTRGSSCRSKSRAASSWYFRAPELWPTNSSNLRSVDYRIWERCRAAAEVDEHEGWVGGLV